MGRVSDKEITIQSGFLDKLDPGDVILADRGFLVKEDFAVRGAALIIPTFTKGNEQLPASDVDKSRAMSRVRVHVEQTIGVVKRRFAILKGPIPISLLMRKDDVDCATLDLIRNAKSTFEKCLADKVKENPKAFYSYSRSSFTLTGQFYSSYTSMTLIMLLIPH